MKIHPFSALLGPCIALSAAALLAGGTASAQEGGIEVFAAETLFDQGTRVSLSHIYKSKGTLFRGSDSISDPLDQTLAEHRLVAAIDHGLRPDLTVSALLPFVGKELESDAGDLRSSGPGDVALLAKYRAYKRDWKRGAFHLSAIGGLELPTGRTSESKNGARLPAPLQPGLGAWNPFLGVATNLNLNRLRFDALALYKLNTEGTQDFEKGDFFSFEVDAAYRFLHTKYPGATASAKLGLQWRHEERAKQDGVTLANSGSNEFLLRSGLTWHPAPNMDISLVIDVPLYQDFHGQQLGMDYRTFLAIGLRF
jgi:hypothetical protein